MSIYNQPSNTSELELFKRNSLNNSQIKIKFNATINDTATINGKLNGRNAPFNVPLHKLMFKDEFKSFLNYLQNEEINGLNDSNLNDFKRFSNSKEQSTVIKSKLVANEQINDLNDSNVLNIPNTSNNQDTLNSLNTPNNLNNLNTEYQLIYNQLMDENSKSNANQFKTLNEGKSYFRFINIS